MVYKSWVAFLQGFLPINPSLVTVIKTEEEKKAICYKLSLAKLIGHHKVRLGPHSDTPKYAFITHGPPLLGIHADKLFLAALHFVKSARFQVQKNGTLGAETKKPRPLFVANYPPKW